MIQSNLERIKSRSKRLEIETSTNCYMVLTLNTDRRSSTILRTSQSMRETTTDQDLLGTQTRLSVVAIPDIIRRNTETKPEIWSSIIEK